MAVVIAGIDEAGYGPLLGPLCVGMSVFRIRDVPDQTKIPDLWKLLSRGVCKHPARGGGHDSRGRIAVADSKELKLANSVKSTHPLVHLERGVLTFARSLPLSDCSQCGDDDTLFKLLGAVMAEHPCYRVPPRSLPLFLSPPEISIAANVLSSALLKAGVDVLMLRCEVVGEFQYNQIVRDTSNKAETTAAAIGLHLRRFWELCANEDPETKLGIVCDRLGGRAAYAGLLQRELEGCTVETIEETDLKSRYAVCGRDANGLERRAGASFLVEGETAHLPVALASMIAKFVRELAMLRFNQHWGAAKMAAMGQEIKPTAGYRNDAHRWLEEIGAVMSNEDRRQLVRLL